MQLPDGAGALASSRPHRDLRRATAPFGLKASQLNLLVVVAQAGPLRRTEIGRVIHLDASTLTRNLAGDAEQRMDRRSAGPCGRARPAVADYEERGGFACGGRAGLEEGPARAQELLGADGTSVLMDVSNSLLGAAPHDFYLLLLLYMQIERSPSPSQHGKRIAEKTKGGPA